MKGIKKVISLVICTVMIFTAVPFAVYADTNISGDFYYTVENGEASIVAYDSKIEEVVTIPTTLGGCPVTSIADGAFANNEIITQINIPEGVLSIGNYAFVACRNLRFVNFADSITSIGTAAFSNCIALDAIILPKGLTAIPNELFAECYEIPTITLPDGILTIGSSAFNKCYNLTEINIPASVTTIEANAFAENHFLAIYYCDTIDKWNEIAIDENNPSLTDLEISSHKFTTTKVESTCIKVGYTLYSCEFCGYNYTVEDSSGALLQHDYEDEFTIDKAATDFESGLKSRHCKNCDAVTDVTVIPATSTASGIYSDTIKWLIKKDGTLTILGSGAISDYKLPIYTPWHQYADKVTALEISKDITRLGNNSFSSLENLKMVTINGAGTELGIYVFPYFPELTVKCYTGSPADYYAQKVDHTITYFGAAEVPVIESIVGTTTTLKKLDGYEYSIDRYNWQKSNVFTIEKDQIIRFYQRKAATSTNPASPSSDAAKGISVSAPDVVLVGYDVISIKPVPDYEYGLEGTLWQEDNKFTKWIIPDITYTVYQRYNGDEDVFAVYDTKGTDIIVNGNNKPIQKNATYLTWLKSHLFTTENSNNLAADVNNDFCIDILDLVDLKIHLLEY